MSGSSFLSGVTAATFAASGVFFLKFWRASSDRFFLLFCWACWCLATERIAGIIAYDTDGAVRTEATQAYSWIFVFRLIAFVLILIAVIDKNRTRET